MPMNTRDAFAAFLKALSRVRGHSRSRNDASAMKTDDDDVEWLRCKRSQNGPFRVRWRFLSASVTVSKGCPIVLFVAFLSLSAPCSGLDSPCAGLDSPRATASCSRSLERRSRSRSVQLEGTGICGLCRSNPMLQPSCFGPSFLSALVAASRSIGSACAATRVGQDSMTGSGWCFSPVAVATPPVVALSPWSRSPRSRALALPVDPASTR
mmetsp:Transcript_10017/g.41530  ORF Transcript_10017/g.41530 Transcript_10017/m.41530 type:complete len:210 (-) Transcript_10017:446-1075(-)